MSTKSKVIKFKAIEDGKSYWPEEWSLELLEKRKKLLGPRLFNYQYQNDPSGGDGNFLQSDWIHFVNEAEVPPLDELFIVQGIDPSFSERALADYFAVATLGRDSNNQAWLLDVLVSHATLPEQLLIVKQQFSRWQPAMIAIEGGPGRALYDTLVSESMLPVVSVSNSLRAKEDRIKTMAIPFQNKQIIVPGIWDEDDERYGPATEGLKEFYDEWRVWPGGRYDDALDAVQIAIEQVVLETMPAGIYQETAPEPEIEQKMIRHRVCNNYYPGTELGRTGQRRHYKAFCTVCDYEIKYSELVEPKPVEEVPASIVRQIRSDLRRFNRYGTFR
jgi:hypothetical protein